MTPPQGHPPTRLIGSIIHSRGSHKPQPGARQRHINSPQRAHPLNEPLTLKGIWPLHAAYVQPLTVIGDAAVVQPRAVGARRDLTSPVVRAARSARSPRPGRGEPARGRRAECAVGGLLHLAKGWAASPTAGPQLTAGGGGGPPPCAGSPARSFRFVSFRSFRFVSFRFVQNVLQYIFHLLCPHTL